MSEQLPPPASDKEKLWGWWYAAKKWQDKLHKSASYKALDIPEDDMGGIQANKEMVVHNSGLHPAWLLAAVLGAGGLYAFSESQKAPTAESTQESSDTIRREVIEKNQKLRLFHNGKEVVAVPKAPDGGY